MALDFPNSPTNGQTYSANNITWVYETSTTTWKVKQDGATGKNRIATVKDVKAYNVDGGTFTADTWVHRTLNTLSDPQSIGLTVSGSIVTVPAGTYSIRWRAPGYLCNRFTSRLAYSTTSSTVASGITYVDGTTGYSHKDDGVCVEESFGDIGSITFTTITYLKIEQYSDQGYTGDTSGLGVSSSISGVDSIFTTLVIEDLATTVKENATYVEGNTKVAVLRDEKNTGVEGGLFVKDAWRDRDLTEKDDPFNFVTLYATTNGKTTPGNGGSNASTGAADYKGGYFSLPAGKYRIKFRAPAASVNEHMAAIGWSPTQGNINKRYDSSGGDFDGGYFYGSSEVVTMNNNTTVNKFVLTSNFSEGSGIVEISETNYFKVIHYANKTSQNSSGANENYGFGKSVDIASPDPETYTIVEIEDLSTAVKDSVIPTTKVAIIQDEKSNGTNGGQAASLNNWHTRDLNTKYDPLSIGITISSNTFSLPAGSYTINISVPGYHCGLFQARLAYNVNSDFSGTTNYVYGSSQFSGQGVSGGNYIYSHSVDHSSADAVVSLSETTYFRVEQNTSASDGGASDHDYGQSCSRGVKEVYTQVRIMAL